MATKTEVMKKVDAEDCLSNSMQNLAVTRMGLLEAQKYLIGRSRTGVERDVSDAINSILYAQRRLDDAWSTLKTLAEP